MSQERFEVILTGKLLPGQDQKAVVLALAGLFKIRPDRVERMIASGNFIIKRGLDHATGLKYQAVLRKAGAFALLRPEGAKPATRPVRPTSAWPPRADAGGNGPLTGREQVAEADAGDPHRTAVAQSKNSRETVPGATGHLPTRTTAADVDESAVRTPAVLDAETALSLVNPGAETMPSIISRDELARSAAAKSGEFNLDPPGVDFRDGIEVQAIPVAPDISTLSVAEPGAVLDEQTGQDAPPPPDTSALNLDPVGTNMLSDKHHPKIKEIDISHLSLNE